MCYSVVEKDELLPGHGNVTSLTDSSGGMVKSYTYDAFGVEESIDSSDTNPFRYCGEYYDSEIEQIYLRARYYDPSLGRFTQQDPAMEDGNNWYVYCANNPVLYVDPSGLAITCSEEDSDTIISLLDELSGNSLELEYQDGEILINKTYDTKNHVGQTLVSELINSGETVNINAGILDPNGGINSKWPAFTDPNGAIQIYIDPNDVLGNGTLYTYVEDSNGNIEKEAFQQYIILGHELIHAWREINGLFDYNEEQGFIPYDGNMSAAAEEYKTMGINYTDAAGNLMRNYSSYNGTITENGLRLENGLNVRVSYQGWWEE